MILGLQEHSTGIWAPVPPDRDADHQLLCLSQILVTTSTLQKAEITVVRGDGTYEVIQKEMTGQREAADEADHRDHDLKPPKAINGG